MGAFARSEAQFRETAGWVALLLSAQTGEVVTPARLLGEESEEKANRAREAEREVNKLLRKMKRLKRAHA